MFQRLRITLTETLGFLPTYSHLGGILGEEKTVIHYWFQGMEHRHLIGFLTLLERLPERKRNLLINEFCRELPMLQNSRLAHDPLSVSHLESLLDQSKGLTWIVGGSEFQKTFVITALGHNFKLRRGANSRVAGIDLNEPKKWVPIDSVTYFKSPLSPATSKKLVDSVWPTVAQADAPLALLNGVWAIAPELHQKILAEARRRHVVVTAPAVPAVVTINAPVTIVAIAPARDNEQAIRLKIERT